MQFNSPICPLIKELLKFFIMSKRVSLRVSRGKQIIDLPRECNTYEEFTEALAILMGVQWVEDQMYENLGRPFDLGVSIGLVLKSVRNNAVGVVAIEKKRTMEYRLMTMEHEVFTKGHASSSDYPFLLVEESGKQHLFLVPGIKKSVAQLQEDPAIKSMWEAGNGRNFKVED